MQLYVLDRAKNTLATTASFYNDKHHKELTAGASTIEITVDKTDDAAQYMQSGNFLVFQDDRGRAWSFTILSYDETQTARTVFAEDVSIELLNKAMDVWNTSQAYPFSYYFDLVTKDTPWKLGVNQLTDLSRKLVYTGRDTGLGRLLSILKGFDNAECQFNIKVQQNKPVEFAVDVYKSIGTVQDNIQIVYNNELNDIKKTESRAQFVTALAGVGGLVENQATTDPGLEKHIDFADIDYKDDNFVSPKGDKFLRAVTANKTFNPGTTTYIEDFYDYDTQSAQELLNRTLTQLKERSEPQYTYDADVKVIDPTLDIGDTVTIIDHDYNPALYLQARVATLDKSYTDPTQGAITFCNYRVLNSTLSDQLRAMQNIIDQMPTSESVKLINSNIINIIATNEELKQQVTLALKSADGKSTIYFDAKPSTAQDGDIAFIKNADGATEIWAFVEGSWKLDVGLATFEDVKKAASAAADAGSQAVVAGQQASAAGADAKSAGDFAASAASQSTIETAAAKSAANSAVDQANLAVSAAGFANDAADQAKTAAASAQADAANALGQASTAITNASTAINAATDAQTKTNSLVTKVDDIAGTIKTLATTETVDQLAGTVATTQSLAQFAADGLKLKADTTTVDQINGTVNDLKGELDVQADKIAATVTASDVTGMLGNYATQSWSEGQISAAKNEISASVETVKNTVDNLQIGANNLVRNSGNMIDSSYWSSTGDFKVITHNYYKQHNGAIFEIINATTKEVTAHTDRFAIQANTTYTLSLVGFAASNVLSMDVLLLGRKSGETADYTDVNYMISGRVLSPSHTEHVVVTFTTGAIDEAYIRFDHNGSTNGIGGGLYFTEVQLEQGNVATPWRAPVEDQATYDWTKSQINVATGEVSASVQKLRTDVTANIAQSTADMATQTWTQGKLSLTESKFSTQISSVNSKVDGLSFGVRNLIPNGSFNDGLKGWSNGNSSAIRAGNEKRNGNSYVIFDSLRYDGVNTGTNYIADLVNNTEIQLQPSTEYTLRIITRSRINNHPITLMQEKDSSGAVITDHAFYVTQTDAENYSENIQHFTTSSTADHGVFRIRLYPGDQFMVGEIILVQGNRLPKDWVAAPEDMATVAQFTSIEETLKGVQITANNAATQSQYNQLANQFTSTIAAVASGNLVADSGWTGAVAKTHAYYSGPNTLYGLGNATTTENYAMSPRFSLKPNTTYTLSIIGFAGSNVASADVFVLARPKGSTKDYEHAYNLLPNKRFSPDAAEYVTAKVTIGPNDSEGYIRIDNNGTNNGVGGTVYFTEVQLEEGSIATPYKLSVSAAQSQITQLQSDINLRVKTGDLINQINVSTEGILIDGSKTQITGDTYIEMGVIKTASIADAAITTAKIGSLAVNTAQIANGAINSAKIASLAVGTAQIADGAISTAKIGTAAITSAQIADASILDAKVASLSASKLTAGTIDASKINVINISAANINAGSLSSLSSDTGDLYLTGTLSAGPYGMTDTQSNSDIVTFWNWKDGQWYTSGEWFDASGNSLMDNSVTIDPVTGILFNTGGFKGATGGSFKIGGGLDSRATLKNTTMYLTNNSSISVDSTSRIIFGGTTGSNGVVFDKYGNIIAQSGSGSWNVNNKNNASVLTVNTSGDNMNVTAKAFVNTSKLSTKMDIKPLTPDDAIVKLLNTDVYAYRYIDTGANGQIFYSPVIDDLHQFPQYRVDDDFVTDDHESRIDGNMVGALVASVKYFKARIDNQAGLISNLQEQINQMKSAS